MPFSQSNTLPDMPMASDRYLEDQISPSSRPLDLFDTKTNEPLPANWSYDNTLDLFSMNTDIDGTAFDFADLTTADTKDLFMDPFSSSSAINGYSMPVAEDTVSLSSDLDSDDQSWSVRPSVDFSMPEPPAERPSKPTTRSSTSAARWSSSPEIKTQEYTPRVEKSTSGRKTRSLSQDSIPSAGQDAQGRNAAKRAAHNIIEKRYRTNMNAKFLALEKAISPAGAPKQASRAGAGSLKKSEILSNALSYIEHVQHENQAMQKELALLKQNMLPGGIWRQTKPSRV
ncbi:hypothetical protein N7468_008840 [Penicillium chermesinum]|uniref:BHLH domain-containing protein n=1 Tax=Penicillium chermesinum TaxID=63820 RepID=A0A9W9TEG0_9EURO|nr:uncharacterized protein N7468_008840 [Penicillium chermesinum]KAJ5219636.1 hypothetical protein N7468_008840 [Penicillium chermesinum]KAJ6153644.1 hypothetical protein N7470_006603 [Penicillium chermesinum]